MKRNYTIFILSFFSLILILFPFIHYASILGLAEGSATKNGRAIIYKVSWWDSYDRLVFWDNDTNGDGSPDVDNDKDGKNDSYSYIGIVDSKIKYPHFDNPTMGVNSKGFALLMTVVEEGKRGNTDPIMKHSLGHFDNAYSFYDYLKTHPGVYDKEKSSHEAKTNFAMLDTWGSSIQVEYHKLTDNHSHEREYQPYNIMREYTEMGNTRTIDLRGIIVRGDYFHHERQSGSSLIDNYSTIMNEGYRETTNKMVYLRDNNMLTVSRLFQGINPEEKDYRSSILRHSSISAPKNNSSSIVIQGIKDNEDNRMTTIWILMGHSEFSVATPVWVWGVINDPEKTPPFHYETTELTESMAYYSKELAKHKNYSDYNYLQKFILPFEYHVLTTVQEELLAVWRSRDWKNPGEAREIGKQMSRVQTQTSADAFRLIKYFHKNVDDEKLFTHAPILEIQPPEPSGRSVNFAVKTPNNTVYDDMFWNYGDGNTGRTPSHTYSKSGLFLASCTATNEKGLSQTDWEFVFIF